MIIVSKMKAPLEFSATRYAEVVVHPGVNSIPDEEWAKVSGLPTTLWYIERGDLLPQLPAPPPAPMQAEPEITEDDVASDAEPTADAAPSSFRGRRKRR